VLKVPLNSNQSILPKPAAGVTRVSNSCQHKVAVVPFVAFAEQIGEQLENIIELIKKSMTGPALSFYEREFDFFHQITDISRIIKCVPLSFILFITRATL